MKKRILSPSSYTGCFSSRYLFVRRYIERYQVCVFVKKNVIDISTIFYYL